MKRNILGRITAFMAFGLLVLAQACGGGSDSHGYFPKDFAKMNDAAKMEYLMKSVSPDSVARFICDASLGRIEGVRIDTLSMAALYAYENYKDDDLQTFQTEFDSYTENLPLPDKMRLRKLAASENPAAMGYQLGLEYVNDIRMGKKSGGEVEAEIDALRIACNEDPEDSLTFKRFMTGFKVALDADGADGVPRQIYDKYSKE